jgi:trimethylamine:corrinoid methyltransferase-like protein
MAERARDEVNRILNAHEPEPIDEDLAAEIDHIVECAKHEIK